MATINNSLWSLADVVKRTNPDGSPVTQMVETLTRRNPILEDVAWMEGNLPTGHRFASRTGLPAVGWRRFNEGVSPGKSVVDQIDETCGMLEGMSVVDTALVELNGTGAAFRASEDAAFLQSFNNEVSTGLFYHSSKTAPEKFMGLSPRFDSTTTSLAGPNIVIGDASASGADQTSIWFVTWGPDSVFGIYPKGMGGGLSMEDLGKQIWDDGTGKKYTVYVTKWNWRLGLVVKDWRQVVRIANVDTSALTSDGATGTKLIDKMIDAYYKLDNPGAGRLVIYCNRTIGAFLHKQAMAKTSYQLSLSEYNGRPITTFLGYPIRVTDAILSTEAAIS